MVLHDPSHRVAQTSGLSTPCSVGGSSCQSVLSDDRKQEADHGTTVLAGCHVAMLNCDNVIVLVNSVTLSGRPFSGVAAANLRARLHRGLACIPQSFPAPSSPTASTSNAP